MKTTLRKLFILLALLAIIASGCTRANKIALFATSTPLFPTSTAAPATQEPSATIPPSNTPLPAVTATPQPTSSPTIAPPTLTFTPAATNTPVSTSTKTPIPRVSADAFFMSKAPTIDGVWDEWTSKQYPITSVVFGRGNWSGSADLHASYRVGWDSKYLYVAVKVFDDVYAQNATGAHIYQGDSIELLVSSAPFADSASLGLISTDYQLGISPGRPSIGENMEAYRWYPKGKTTALTNVAIGAVPMTGGYRIEFAVPWTDLGMTPSRGMVLGFAVSVSDNDNTNDIVQQTLVSSATFRTLTDPTTWGLLNLK